MTDTPLFLVEISIFDLKFCTKFFIASIYIISVFNPHFRLLFIALYVFVMSSFKLCFSGERNTAAEEEGDRSDGASPPWGVKQ